MKNIDAHSHFIPKDLLPTLKELGTDLVPLGQDNYQLVHGDHVTYPMPRGRFDADKEKIVRDNAAKLYGIKS